MKTCKKFFVAALCASLFPTLATVSSAAVQYWNPHGTASVGGAGDWDSTYNAWADTTAATSTPGPWINGNDAWFSLNSVATNVVTVNAPIVGQMYFNNGTYTFLPGSGPLTLYGPVTNNNNTRTFDIPIVLAADQNWHLNGQMIFNGAVTGGKTLHVNGPQTLTFTNTLNDFAGVWTEFGNVNFRNGGNVLGGANSELKFGGPRQPRSVLVDIRNTEGEKITDWYAGDLVANGYGEIELRRIPDNATVSNLIHFAGTPRRENRGVIRIGQYSGNTDGSAQIRFDDLDPALLGPDNLLPIWIFLTNEPLFVTPGGWLRQFTAYSTAYPGNDPTVFFHNNTTRELVDDPTVYALKISGSTLTIPEGHSLTNVSGEFLIQGHILGGGNVELGAKEALLYVNGNPLRFEPSLNATGGATLFGGGRLAVPRVTWSGGTQLHNAYLILDTAEDFVWDMAATGDIYGPPVTTGFENGITKEGAGKLTILNATDSHVSRLNITAGDIEIKNSRFASMHNGITLNQDGMTFTVTNSIYRYGGNEFRTSTGRNNIGIEVYGSGDPAKPTIVYGRGGDNNFLYDYRGHGVGIGFEGYGNRLLIDGRGVTGGAVWTNMVWNTRGLTVGVGAGSSNNVARIIGGGEFWDEMTVNNVNNSVGVGANAANNRLEIVGGDGFVSKLLKLFPNVIGSAAGADNNTVLVDGMGFPGSAWLDMNGENGYTIGRETAQHNSLVVRDGGKMTKGSFCVGRGASHNTLSITGKGTSVIGGGGGSTFEVGVPYSTRASGVITAQYHAISNLVYVADGAHLGSYTKWQTVIGGLGATGNSENNFGDSTGNMAHVDAGGYWDIGNEAQIGRVWGGGNTARGNAIVSSGPGAIIFANHIITGVEHGDATWGYSQAVGNMLIVEDEGFVRCTHLSTGHRSSAAPEGGVYDNRVFVRDNGHLYVQTQLRLGADNDFLPRDNKVEVTTGGILEAHNIRLCCTSNNTVRVYDGGVWQLRGNRAPTFEARAGRAYYNGMFTVDNGIVSFTNLTTFLVKDNWTQAAYANVTWAGNNGLRLNNITMSNGGANSYTFEPNVSPTNWAFLQMINGDTVYRTSNADIANPLVIASTSSMLCLDTAARVEMPFEMNGTLDIINSTLTVTHPATITGDTFLDNGHLVFNTGATVNGAIVIDMDAADSANLPSVTGLFNLGSTGIIRFTGEVVDGKQVARIDHPQSGPIVFDKSNLPPNYNYVHRDGIVTVRWFDPTTIIIVR